MSLKAFHIFFIVVSALMCFGIAAFRGSACLETSDMAACAQAGASFVAGAGLIYYGVRFLKKTKEIGYL